MKAAFVFFVCCVLPVFAADTWQSAKIVDVGIQTRTESGNPFINNGGISQSNAHVFTVEIGDARVTATEYQMGGGGLYMSSHPEEFMKGGTLEAHVNRGMLELKTVSGKVVKLKILTMEKL